MSEAASASTIPTSVEETSQGATQPAPDTAKAESTTATPTASEAPQDSAAEQSASTAEASTEDDIAKMKAQVERMEQEAAALREKEKALSQVTQELVEQPADVDARSVFVGNLDDAASPEEIQKHFASCGAINRVTILLDRFTGLPRGYAYVEFAEPADVVKALTLNESIFLGRSLKVIPKRTNYPGMSRGGRGGYRGRWAPRRPYRGGRGSFRGVYNGGDRAPPKFSPY